MDKFYVGARVVAVRTNTNGWYRKGCTYEVLSISRFKCKCKSLVLDIGISINDCDMFCSRCNTNHIDTHGIGYVPAEHFRLLEPDTELSETRSDEILDLINANG